MITIIIATLTSIILAYYTLLKLINNNKTKYKNLNLPPGSCGLIPIIGESLSFARAMSKNRTALWVRDRVDHHGAVFKTSLFGSETIVVTGQEGNKFVFSGHGGAFANNQPETVAMIFGKQSIFEMSGDKHRLVRGVVAGFLKPDSIRRYLGLMESVVVDKLKELDGKDSVSVVPLVKSITFNVVANILFGFPAGKERDKLLEDFKINVKGLWSIPLDFPGTTFHKALKARERLCQKLSKIVATRRKETEERNTPRDDIVTGLILLKNENGEALLSEAEINDVLVSVIMASYDTVTVVLCFFIRLLANDSDVFERVLEEQREVAKIVKERKNDSGDEGKLEWNDVLMMKYSWRVIQEIMRIDQPIFGNFRRVLKDVKFGSYDIPKGWQVFWVCSETHFDNNIFEDAYNFNPSRFDKSYPPYTYVPFGAGPRICPGIDFARAEILLVIHHMVIRWRWTQKILDEPIVRRPVPLPAMGLPIILKPIK